MRHMIHQLIEAKGGRHSVEKKLFEQTSNQNNKIQDKKPRSKKTSVDEKLKESSKFVNNEAVFEKIEEIESVFAPKRDLDKHLDDEDRELEKFKQFCEESNQMILPNRT